MKTHNYFQLGGIIVAPIICTVVAEATSIHWGWMICFSLLYSCGIAYFLREQLLGLFPTLESKEDVESKEPMIAESTKPSPPAQNLITDEVLKEESFQQMADSKEIINDLMYRWLIWKNWAILLQKQYVDATEVEKTDIIRRLTECRFKLVHYETAYADYFMEETLTRLPDEPECKETQPALLFVNDGTPELMNKGIVIKFV